MSQKENGEGSWGGSQETISAVNGRATEERDLIVKSSQGAYVPIALILPFGGEKQLMLGCSLYHLQSRPPRQRIKLLDAWAILLRFVKAQDGTYF